MPDERYVDPRKALYWAGQWTHLRGASTAIPDTLDEQFYSLGPFWGDDEYGEKYLEAIGPGVEGGRIVLHAIGDCSDGVSTGITQTVNEYKAADIRSGDLIR